MSGNANILVIGVGGGGNNAINRMSHSSMQGVNFVAINTDVQVLKKISECYPFAIGGKLTKGLGTGANPEIGRRAAIESKDEILNLIQGADMIFIAAGMGGGTGTGASPVIAQVARAAGIVTVGVVTKPFTFEGRKRMEQAEDGISKLKDNVDSLILLSNQSLLDLTDKNVGIFEAFKFADDVLKDAIQGITDLIIQTGIINLDLQDIKAVLKDSGRALIGIGYGEGQNRAVDAANASMNCPLLENNSIIGANRLMINIAGGDDLALFETEKAASLISDKAIKDANIIFGTTIDSSLGEKVKVTVIAAGLKNEDDKAGYPIDQRGNFRNSSKYISHTKFEPAQ